MRICPSGGKTSSAEKNLQKSYMEPPKCFWQYFDLYRRKKITLAEYVEKTSLSATEIKTFYYALCMEQTKNVEDAEHV